MTKARQRERAKRRKDFAAIPMSCVHGFVDAVEKPIKYWDGKRIQFVEAPPEGAVVTIIIDNKQTKKMTLMEGDKCK